jgi:hypothetical protein
MGRDRPPFEGPYDDAERTQEERRRLVKEAMDRFYAPEGSPADRTPAQAAGRQVPKRRDRVSTPRGTRPQRSTEEHGSGAVREVPARPGREVPSDEVGPPSARPGTPEGHTPERPAAEEYGKVGTPAAALSTAVPHAADAEAAASHEQTEEHEEAMLGPIDWRAWAATALGVGVAALIAILFYVASLPR